jgi:arginyl-tRNA synthetase
MNTLLSMLENLCTQATQAAFPELTVEEIQEVMDVTQSRQERFGHYQCNVAMKLAKVLQTNPRVIATSINEELRKEKHFTTELAGAGFINITLSAAFLSERINHFLLSPKFGIVEEKNEERVIVDFSSPNIAKEMHVGHLRSTIIGDCIARLFEFLGSDVLRLNHLGDWGTQFGMLIAYMQEEVPEVLSGQKETALPELMAWYKASKARFDADPDFKERSQKEVVALQGGDPKTLAAWKMICEISERGYREVYRLLDVEITDRGESFYNAMLPGLVKDLEDKRLLENSNGAKCFFLDGFQNRDGDPLPLIVQKSDGGYNYATTDLTALKQRVEVEKADRIIYVIDQGQSQHMQMVFQAVEKAGYADPKQVRLDHVAFGLVLGPDGKKFRTRSGETEKLVDLLNHAVVKAREIIEERQLEMDEEEKTELAKALGIAAVKYADLSCNRNSDYAFSYDKMLRFEGNTAAFQMYSYVRVAGIKRKVGVDVEALLSEGKSICLEHPSEQSLALHLLQFGEVLELISQDLLPNRLTDYLFNLAQKFNVFFRDCRVEGSDEQSSRLLLAEAVARVMKQGFHILGIKTVNRM